MAKLLDGKVINTLSSCKSEENENHAGIINNII
jgi:hypothetical protein